MVWMRYTERSANVSVSLWARQSDLRYGFAPPLKNIGGQLVAWLAHSTDRDRGNQFGLIEPSFPAPGRMQGYRNNYCCLGICWKLGDCIGKPSAKEIRCRKYPFILEQVNQLAEFGGVGSVSHGTCKVGLVVGASLANQGLHICRQIFTTNSAGLICNRKNGP